MGRRLFTLPLLKILVMAGNWEHWLNRVQEYVYPFDYKPEYSSILVPNVDNVRTSFLMETIAKQSKVGDTKLNYQPRGQQDRLPTIDINTV